MSAFSSLLAPDRGQAARTLTLLSADSFQNWRASQPESVRTLADAQGFKAEKDSLFLYPASTDSAGHDWAAALGLGSEPAGRWSLATAASRLPAGHYRLAGPLPLHALHGWLMAQYRFDRYLKQPEKRCTLLVAEPAIAPALVEAEAATLVRDLVNTPAQDMGPAEVEAAIRQLAEESGARCTSHVGEDLLRHNFPATYLVGHSSPRPPRLVIMEWGKAGQPLVGIVGKGICFDTGGLNLKPGKSMALMKKDMGGAAHAIALAKALIAAKAPVRLRLVVATADNAISGSAMRPGDILTTRSGLTVEIGNTDAEGRLVLSDALTAAVEGEPALLFDFATLTGAARVALGPDIVPFFANDDTLAQQLLESSAASEDPLWRLPLWEPYRRLFRSPIADTNNVSESGFAGAIIAGLFLQNFVPKNIPWAHFDIYAWSPDSRPGRPKGALSMAIRACQHLVAQRF